MIPSLWAHTLFAVLTVQYVPYPTCESQKSHAGPLYAASREFAGVAKWSDARPGSAYDGHASCGPPAQPVPAVPLAAMPVQYVSMDAESESSAAVYVRPSEG